MKTIYRVLTLCSLTLFCGILSVQAQSFSSVNRTYKVNSSSPTFQSVRATDYVAIDTKTTNDYQSDFSYTYKPNRSVITVKQYEYKTHNIANTLAYNSYLGSSSVGTSAYSSSVSNDIMSNLAVPMFNNSIATIGISPPSNPSEGASGDTTPPNGPLGDALIPLLLLVAIFSIKRLLKNHKEARIYP